MKNVILIVAVVFIMISTNTMGQKFAELYKNETIELVAIAGYGTSNNWDEVFSDPVDNSSAKDIGKQKQIVVAPDGSVFMSHKTHYEIWKFDKQGNLVKKFGQKGSNPGQFVMMPAVEGILGGKYVYTSDVHGRMQFYDLDGNYQKILKLDYMPLDSKPLGNLKIAILGHVPWSNRRTKHIISIKDYNTGDEKIIWSRISDNNKGVITVNTGDGSILSFSVPNSNRSVKWPRMATSKSGNLIVATPSDGTVTVYSPQGEIVNSFALNISAIKIEQSDIDEYYKTAEKNIPKFKERLENTGRYNEQEVGDMVKQYREEIKKLEDPGQYSEYLPYFTNLMVDSDGNLLVFEYTKSKNLNKFRVYSFNSMGKYLNTSSFNSNEYKISLSPRKFIFHNGFIYNVAKKKEGSGNLMRLVKFEVN